MVAVDEVKETLNQVGINDKQIQKVLATTRKTDIDSPDKLYYYLNLADVTNIKKVARAIIGVFGEEGHEFMRQKVENSRNATKIEGNRKQEWAEKAQDVSFDKAMNEIMKAAKLKTIMNATGINNGQEQGQGQQQQQYPMAEEPIFKDGKMLMNDDGTPVTKKYPVNPDQGQAGMGQGMMQMLMKMMEMQNNNGNQDKMMDMFKIVMEQQLNSGNDEKLAEMEKELINTKKQMNQKELQHTRESIQNVLGDYGEKIQELEQQMNSDMFDELATAKQKMDKMQELGVFGSQTEEDWEKEKKRKQMQMDREVKHKTLDTLRDVGKEVGKPITSAIGQGLKQGLSESERGVEGAEVDNMLDTIKEQKQETTMDDVPQGSAPDLGSESSPEDTTNDIQVN